MELLKRSGVQLAGARAVVVGRSNIVGLPMALLLQNADATVTVVHSRTKGGAEISAQADVLVAALGRAEAIGADWVKPGAAVIDVGINSKDVSAASYCAAFCVLYCSAVPRLHFAVGLL